MNQPAAGWLDLASAPKRRKRTRKSKAKRARKTLEVIPAHAIPREVARRFGPGRIWGCDGEWVAFRPKRMIDGVFTQVANPEAMERHERFIRLGHYVYHSTEDDVQLFKLTERSPFKRKFGSLLEMATAQVKRAVIMAAVKREWTLYVDALEELAVRIKSQVRASDGQGPGALHNNQWQEMLVYLDIQIAMRGGPTPAECSLNLQRVRIARNGGDGKRILVA